jgi:transposase InsO family protein
VRQANVYQAIRGLNEEGRASISRLCDIAGIPRSSYYKWLHREPPEDERVNEAIAKAIKSIHDEDPTKGYRRIRDDLARDYGFRVSDNRVLRICRYLNIKSTVKYRPAGCTISDKNPQHIAENVLNREFTAEKPNEKWTTDITEFSLFGRKLYLSPILDMYNGEIISYSISERPVLGQVLDMLDKAFDKTVSTEGLILHSDQGWQYQHKQYQAKLSAKGVVQSMSRKGNCLDNAVMENFFGLLKSELLYLKTFYDYNEFVTELEEYIRYYNNRRIKSKLKGLSPVQYRIQSSKVA